MRFPGQVMDFFGLTSLRLLRPASLGVMLALSSLTLQSCTNTIQGEYSDVNDDELIDDKWNELDANRTAEKLVKSMLTKPWIRQYQAAGRGQFPVVVVDEIRSDADEHIDTTALEDAIEKQLVNSGLVRMVDGKSRDKLLKELKFQQSGEVNKATAKRRGRQIGADFILGGVIAGQRHKNSAGRMSVSYKTNLKLTDLETSILVWAEDHQIKKKFKRASVGM